MIMLRIPNGLKMSEFLIINPRKKITFVPVNFSEHREVVKEGNRQFLPCIDFNRFRSILLQVCAFVKKFNKKRMETFTWDRL